MAEKSAIAFSHFLVHEGGIAAIIAGDGGVRFQANHFREIGNGPLELPFALVGQAAIAVSRREFGVEPQRLVVIQDRLVKITEFPAGALPRF